MTNEEYLQRIKKLDEELKLDLRVIVRNDEGDSYRRTKALEIIAETLMNIDVGIANIEGQLNRR